MLRPSLCGLVSPLCVGSVIRISEQAWRSAAREIFTYLQLHYPQLDVQYHQTKSIRLTLRLVGRCRKQQEQPDGVASMSELAAQVPGHWASRDSKAPQFWNRRHIPRSRYRTLRLQTAQKPQRKGPWGPKP